VDVEEATPRIDRILQKFLHPEELDWLSKQALLASKDIQGDDPGSAYLLPTLLWSAKESVFKWYGSGQVDFSEHIRLSPFSLGREGMMTGAFCKTVPFPFTVEYKLLGNLCLSWVMGNYTG
jgi:phosphopantetheinyl transferase